VNVGSKELVDGLFFVACISWGMDCLHKCSVCADAITKRQKRAKNVRPPSYFHPTAQIYAGCFSILGSSKARFFRK
jgi:hypothetical protein